MPLRLRMIPTSRLAGGGGGPTTERAIEFEDTVGQIRVGRRADLELPLPFPALSGVHARIMRAEDGGQEGWLIEDLGSKNGTFLRGKRLEPGDKRPLISGVEISFAHVKLIFDGKAASSAPPLVESGKHTSDVSHRSSTPSKRTSKDKIPAVVEKPEGTGTIARRLVSDLFAAAPGKNPPTLTVVSGVPGGGIFRIAEPDRRYVLGRDKVCAFRVKLDEISREHAAFTRRWNGVFVTDLGSKNGLRVNGVQAIEQRLQDGDLIQIGPVKLRLFDPEDRYMRDIAARADASPPPADSPSPAPASPPQAAAASPSPPNPKTSSRPDLHPAVSAALAIENGEHEQRPERVSVRMKLAMAWTQPKTSRASIVISAIVLMTVALLVAGFILSD
jgi:pSer/pThr/pTyr-binding forkhead associated (FHA) protein